MAYSGASQGAIIASAFFLPVLTYIFFARNQRLKNTAGPLPPPTEITALYIHPIKSCHGIKVQSAKLLPTGLDLDRQWMWVTYSNFEFLTIRQNARMTLIRTFIDTEKDTLTVTAPAPNSADEKVEFTIPAHPTSDWLAKNTTSHGAIIWGTSVASRVYATEITGAFDAFFGKEVRLVYKPPFSEDPRLLVSNGKKAVLGRVATTCFPDMMPVLVGTESSIAELNTRLKAAANLTIDIRRFRPNILVEGDSAKPWDEDRWKTIKITGPSSSSELTLDVTNRCARCRVPNVDPDTAEEHAKQPWDTLVKYRRIDEGLKFKPCYGMLCVPRNTGEIKVGMKLHVTEVTDKHVILPP